MTLDEFLTALPGELNEDIYLSRAENANELYIEVNPDKIKEICTFINLEQKYPLISMFANDERSVIGCYGVYYVFADRQNGQLLIVKIKVAPDKMEINSISENVYAAAMYEREIKDLFGIVPIGHPNAKRLVFHGNWPDGEYPLRKEFNGSYSPAIADEKIEFTKVNGNGVYEIPVGPVHAGIIEPGHFRFSVVGEPIIHLEAQLYYVHKGIEKM
ncbi:MAG: NADH-quinone oxidoreductase subunit C, partial [Clostridiales bacterium]|nr:NADH-quinone oxidoreductase subunit C [Clostridiales bacterium]